MAGPGRPGDPYKVKQVCVGVGVADVTIAWAPAPYADYYEVWNTWSNFLGTTTKPEFVIRGVSAPSSIIPPFFYLEVFVVAVKRDGYQTEASNIVQIRIDPCLTPDPCASKTGITRWWCERTTPEKVAIVVGGAIVVGATIWFLALRNLAQAAAPKITVVTGEEERG